MLSKFLQITKIHNLDSNHYVDSRKSRLLCNFSEMAFRLAVIGFCLEAIIIAIVHLPAVIGFLYFFGTTLALYAFLFRRVRNDCFILYTLFGALTLGLYFFQYLAFPEFMGFSGGLGIGTDDAFFFASIQAIDGISPIGSSLIRFGKLDLAFPKFIHFLTPLPTRHPLDVLFFATMFAALIPLITGELALLLTKDEKTAKLAYLLSMFCPFLLAQSLILLREGMICALSMATLFLFLKKRYIEMALVISLLLYIRTASGLLCLTLLIIVAYLKMIQMRGLYSKLFYVMILVVVATIFATLLYPMVYSYLQSKNIVVTESIVRYDHIGRFVDGRSDSIVGKIYDQPLWIRIPLGFVYFFFAPNFVPQAIIEDGLFIPRSFMVNLSALFMTFFYFRYFIQGFFSAIKNRDVNLKITIGMYLVFVFIISQFSMQYRHKTMFLPLFYIIVAYGYYHRTRLGEILGNLGSIFLFLGQFLRTLVRL